MNEVNLYNFGADEEDVTGTGETDPYSFTDEDGCWGRYGNDEERLMER